MESAMIPGTQVECEILNVPMPISGVHFLLKDGNVMYVGQSRNLLARIWTHEKEKLFDEVLFLRVDPKKLDEVERYWIRHFKPQWRSHQITNPLHNRFAMQRWNTDDCLPPVPFLLFLRHPLGESLTEAHEV